MADILYLTCTCKREDIAFRGLRDARGTDVVRHGRCEAAALPSAGSAAGRRVRGTRDVRGAAHYAQRRAVAASAVCTAAPPQAHCVLSQVTDIRRSANLGPLYRQKQRQPLRHVCACAQRPPPGHANGTRPPAVGALS